MMRTPISAAPTARRMATVESMNRGPSPARSEYRWRRAPRGLRPSDSTCQRPGPRGERSTSVSSSDCVVTASYLLATDRVSVSFSVDNSGYRCQSCRRLVARVPGTVWSDSADAARVASTVRHLRSRRAANAHARRPSDGPRTASPGETAQTVPATRFSPAITVTHGSAARRCEADSLGERLLAMLHFICRIVVDRSRGERAACGRRHPRSPRRDPPRCADGGGPRRRDTDRVTAAQREAASSSVRSTPPARHASSSHRADRSVRFL